MKDRLTGRPRHKYIMRINEDFLDSESVDDIVRNDEVDIEKITDSYSWLLEAYVYAEYEIEKPDAFILTVSRQAGRLTEKTPDIIDFLLETRNINGNKLYFYIYMDSTFRTLDSFLRYVHALTSIIWKHLNTGNTSDNGALNYTLYKNVRGEFRTNKGGDVFSGLCDSEILRSDPENFYDYYNVAQLLFYKKSTYQTLTHFCSPMNNIFEAAWLIAKEDKSVKRDDLKFSNTDNYRYKFVGSSLERDLKGILLVKHIDLQKDDNIRLYQSAAGFYPQAGNVSTDMLDYVNGLLGSESGFRISVFSYMKTDEKLCIYVYIGTPFIHGTNRHITLQVLLPLDETIDDVWTRCFDEPIPESVRQLCRY